MVFREVVRPILFRLDAEQAHRLTLDALAAVAPVVHRARGVRLLEGGRQRESGRPGRTTVFGVDFPSRVGLAAGLDKDGVALPVWPALGFGFVEVGTVTARPQPGNARPRLFRLRSDEAIVNRMGFNNAGAAALAVRLERLRRTGPLGVPLGISLGKSKATPIEDSVDDYLTSLRLLHRYADYVAVNVSSPNTPGLRSLQDAEALAGLVRALVAEATQLAGSVARPAPVLVKIAPDLTDGAVEELVDVCLAEGASGVIAANTTTGRGELRHEDRSTGQRGGLSGPPLLQRAVEIVARVSKQAGERLPVIGVGGVSSADDARRMIDAGASLVQIYTGLIYQGPRLVRSVGREIG